jgi:hypothetical protein
MQYDGVIDLTLLMLDKWFINKIKMQKCKMLFSTLV